jgi:heptaprenylglyceryl phosphate synthase
MPAALKIKRTIENYIWKIQFSLDLPTLPERDKELMRKFGEPQINVGGSFGIAPNTYTLPVKWIKVRTDLPYIQEFDSKSPTFETNTQIKAQAFQAAFVAAYDVAFVALRANADTFTGEEIHNIV